MQDTIFNMERLKEAEELLKAVERAVLQFHWDNVDNGRSADLSKRLAVEIGSSTFLLHTLIVGQDRTEQDRLDLLIKSLFSIQEARGMLYTLKELEEAKELLYRCYNLLELEYRRVMEVEWKCKPQNQRIRFYSTY